VVAVRFGILVGAIVAMTAACANIGTGAAPPLSVTETTLMYGWENYFSIEWAADQSRNGTQRVTGYVYNRKGEYALDLRVMAQAVDASGAVVGQRIAFVPGGVGGLGRVYFEVPNLPVASTYRVSVFDFTWSQGTGDSRP
jgi:ABC-type glycerol-3-phosphate transport system substrate-binding protein